VKLSWNIQQLYRILLVLIIVLFISGCAGRYSPLPLNTSPAERQAHLTSKIDRILDEEQSSMQSGISVIVKKNGAVIYKRSKGLADINLDIPVTSNTIFEIASVSKPITAIAVMQLREKKLLLLNDSVRKWMPELPKTWDNITIHYLLSHQSGIPNIIENIPIGFFFYLDGLDNQRVIQRFVYDDTLLFKPGSSAKYSNSNYVLLAEVIGRASGMTYSQYLHENIFLPLGMYSTYTAVDTPPGGASVALDYGHHIKILGATLEMVGPIGIRSTTSDLILLVDGLLSGKLIKTESLRLMTTPNSEYFIEKSESFFYGYGWYIPKQKPALSVFSHKGDLHGFGAYLHVDHHNELGCIILGNAGDKTRQTIHSIYWAVRNAYQ